MYHWSEMSQCFMFPAGKSACDLVWSNHITKLFIIVDSITSNIIKDLKTFFSSYWLSKNKFQTFSYSPLPFSPNIGEVLFLIFWKGSFSRPIIIWVPRFSLSFVFLSVSLKFIFVLFWRWWWVWGVRVFQFRNWNIFQIWVIGEIQYSVRARSS